MFKNTRKKPRETKRASPIDTTTNSSHEEISPIVTKSTCWARTISAGSAIEIKKPRRNPHSSTTGRLLVFTKEEPVKLPMGVMPISTPNKNKVNPMITKIDPIKKRIIKENPSGTKVKFKPKTIKKIGITALILSLKSTLSIFK